MMVEPTHLIEGPISADLQLSVTNSSGKSGAVVSFLGVIRNDFVNGKEVTKIEYSAYRPMAEKMFTQIERRLVTDSSVHRVQIFHSVGTVAVGEASLLVCVQSKHRKDAFALISRAVDEIKAYAPVWKKEFYTDDSSDWVSCDHCHSELFGSNS